MPAKTAAQEMLGKEGHTLPVEHVQERVTYSLPTAPKGPRHGGPIREHSREK